MGKAVLARLSYANVISTIALFAALGGGYAVAFSGSGSLQKAAADDLDASFANVRTLTGFGALQARCEDGSGQDDFELRLDNTTSKTIRLDAVRANPDSFGDPYQVDVVDPATGSDAISLPNVANKDNLVFIHLSKPETGNKAQVDVTVAAYGGNVCSETSLRIEALNTQQ